MFRKLVLLFVGLMVPAVAAADVVTVSDDYINAGDTVTFTADNTYVLDGFVFVEDGAVLNIEAGTVIKGMPGQGESASALVIARGGKIFAEGTAANPIIFTAESDDVSDVNSIPFGTSGLWGGVILLGNARINTATGVGQIEGIPSEEPRGAYGGDDDTDSSGVIRYVSIRHGGTDIGEGNEINGLTFGAVGNGTIVEYVEVFNNNDDGYEWFGGTVNCKYLISAFNKDDSFDYDEGWRGKGQFWFTIQGAEYGNRGGEHDGGTTPEDGTPFAIPTIFNATYIGSGMDSDNVDSDFALEIRDNAGGKYRNSIFMEFAGKGVDVEDLESGADSRERLETGDLVLANNIWYGFGGGIDLASIAEQDYVATHLADNMNAYTDPMLRGISRIADRGLDPRPVAASPVYSNLADYPAGDDFFTHANYKGAFGSSNWAAGWTKLDFAGFITETEAGGGSVVTVDDDYINAGDTVTFTADNTYVLDGFVFVEEGAVLNIEPGTVIKGMPGQGESASALVIARGGKIFAEGTAANPIIFTAESDDVDDIDSIPFGTSGLWGGVILLGNARINTATGVGQIEGIPSEEPRGAYGGDDDTDSSGVIRYVSIRHGGTDIGEGNEINGLTFGAVGNGTIVEYVEVFNNNDDGYEWFGGTVNCKYLISAFNKDDSFDYDEGWRGKGQFWFTIQGAEYGNRGGEHDGGTTPEDGTPFAIPTIFNATYIGSGMDSDNVDSDFALEIRDNAGGKYRNSIFMEFAGKGVDVEDLESGADSRERLETGDLVLANNIWYGFGGGIDLASIAEQDYVATHLADNMNAYTDPMLRSISRTADSGLDPRPMAESPVYSNLADYPAGDDFFTHANYKGAFGSSNWAADWTKIWQAGFMSDGEVVSVADETAGIPTQMELDQNYPNPFNPATTISFHMPVSGAAKLTVYNVVGRKVETLVDGMMAAGTHSVTWDAMDYAAGVYFYKLEAGSMVTTRKMTLIK